MSETKPRGYWKSITNVVNEAKKVMEEHNLKELPSQTRLEELGYSGLNNAVGRYHGGYHRFRKRLGQEQLKIRDDTWKNLEYVIQQVREVMREHDLKELPSQRRLVKLGYSMLGYAISKYHGGFYKIRKMLGQERPKIKDGSWKDLAYTLEQALALMKKSNLEELPTQIRLQELKHSSLSRAITTYHGGFQRFREILAQRLGIRSEKERLEELLGGYVKP
jgi:hypothetical protein